MSVQSPAAQALLEQIRQVFAALVELDKHQPHEAAVIVRALVGHVRSWKPFLLITDQASG